MEDILVPRGTQTSELFKLPSADYSEAESQARTILQFLGYDFPADEIPAWQLQKRLTGQTPTQLISEMTRNFDTP